MSENAQKSDVLQMVTDAIIAQLQKGLVPWHMPWGDAGLPRNLITNRPYKGINLFLLACQGFAHNLFLTYNQVNQMGGKVKKGETGLLVVWWNTKAGVAHESTAENPESTTKSGWDSYKVFNVDQCEKLNLDDIPPFVVETSHKSEDIISDIQNCPAIRSKEAKSFYEPLRDFINIPKKDKFGSESDYYGLLFKLLIHATGHHSRLGRSELIQMSEWGPFSHSGEELVAEMGSCILQSLVGVANGAEESAEYIDGWISKLSGNKRLLLTAASQAQKAVEFILNIVPSEVEADT